MSRNKLTLITALLTSGVVLSGCSSSIMAYPANVLDDVKTCNLVRESDSSSPQEDMSYLGSLEKESSVVSRIKTRQALFEQSRGDIAQAQMKSFYWELESVTASNYKPKVPGSIADAAELLARIRYGTDGKGVYKIGAREKFIQLRAQVSSACTNLEKKYPPTKYGLPD